MFQDIGPLMIHGTAICYRANYRFQWKIASILYSYRVMTGTLIGFAGVLPPMEHFLFG